MNHLLDWSIRLYALLLRLYPRPFRDEFGDEMQSVFAEAATGAATSGSHSALWFCGRELAHLPGSVLAQQLRVASSKQIALTTLFLLSLLLAAALTVFGILGAGVLSSPIAWIITYWLLVFLALGLVPLAKRTSPRAWTLVGLAVLAMFSVLPTSLSAEFPASLQLSLPPVLESIVGYTICLMPSVALVVVALLLYSSLKLYQEWRRAVVSGGGRFHLEQAGQVSAAVLFLSVLVLAVALFNLYWALVWDSTNDPLDVIWLILPLLAAFSSGLLLAVALSGRMKFAGLLYGVLIPLLLFGVYASAKSVDYRQLTRARAAQVSDAVERYHAREGRYPEKLQQLAPWYLLSLPEPVLINGLDWCYDGGADYFRLGYADREHWSAPNWFGQLYAVKGAAPTLEPICTQEITAFKTTFPEEYPWR